MDKIKVKGLRTEVIRATIEITPAVLVNHVVNLIHRKYPKFAGNYICNGRWMMYSYTHPHNGDDIFEEGELAAAEELKIQEYILFLNSLAKN